MVVELCARQQLCMAISRRGHSNRFLNVSAIAGRIYPTTGCMAHLPNRHTSSGNAVPKVNCPLWNMVWESLSPISGAWVQSEMFTTWHWICQWHGSALSNRRFAITRHRDERCKSCFVGRRRVGRSNSPRRVRRLDMLRPSRTFPWL